MHLAFRPQLALQFSAIISVSYPPPTTYRSASIRVIVTEPNYQNALAVCRSLRGANHEPVTIGPLWGQSNFSRSVDSSHSFRPHHDTFENRVFEVARLTNAEVIIPVGFRSVFSVHEIRESLSSVISFAIAPSASLDLARNKANLFETARALGIAVPRTVRTRTYEDLTSWMSDFELPFVVKAVSELSDLKTTYFYTRQEVQTAIETDTLAEPISQGELVIQELILGPGQGFFSLYQDGSCRRVMMHERIRENPSTGGSSWAAKSIESDALFTAGTALLDELRWHGPAMVEFKLDSRTGVPVLMELNPKLWGSLDLTVASGVDIPNGIVKIAMGENLQPVFDFKTDVYFYWPLNSFESLVGSGLANRAKFHTNIDLSDLFPHLIQLAQTLARPALTRLRRSQFFRILFWIKSKGTRVAVDRIIGETIGIPTKNACEVNDFLWIGARPRSVGITLLSWGARREIVSLVREEKVSRHRRGVVNHHLPLPEFVGAPPEVLDDYVNFLTRLEEGGKKAYLHCREGVGRAPMVAVAFLLKGGMPIERAIARVREKRRATDLNSDQIKSLEIYRNWLRVRGLSS